MRIMRIWSAFSANDINNDNILDMREMKLLIWLVTNAKPTKSEIEREVRIMDRDHSGTIDRIEWVSYLAGPPASIYQHGNMDYYDFELREMFEKQDKNNDGLISAAELCNIIKLDWEGVYYSTLNEENKKAAEPLFQALTRDGMRELK